MRTATYKGRILGNSINAYNFYKQATGRGLQADMAILGESSKKLSSIDPNKMTPEELVEASKQVDTASIVMGLYVALRKSGDPEVRRKTPEQILDELEMGNLSDPKLLNVMVELISPKKELAE